MFNHMRTKLTQRQFLFACFGFSLTLVFLSVLVMYYFFWSRYVSTENAYVSAEIAQVTALTSARVEKIHVKDTDTVKEGDLLVELDHTDAKLILEKAQAEFEKAQAEFDRTKLDCERRVSLSKSGSVSKEEVTTSQNSHKIAAAILESAKVMVEQAQVDLDRTSIKSPTSGTVAKRQVQLGQRVMPGSILMSVVPTDVMHVDANFKETQIKAIKVGQTVTMTTDFHGDDVVYHGKVVGLSGGTGSAFSVIPAQNATGNWIKVVQRLPIRITLDPQELKKNPLYVGLSVHATVDLKGE